jgi:prepilin-type N-terminal cleavage/methylation domain-containing protein
MTCTGKRARVFARPRSLGQGARRAFTLVELMVAMALMTILTGSVVFIFMQAQEIFKNMSARVAVYQYARYAFDQMERDFANVVQTRDMEFFNDQPNNPRGRRGHYDAFLNEHIPIRDTGNRHGDPINGDGTYNYAFTLRQPQPYTDADQRQHRWDSVYFKTVTVINQKTTSALIEYSIADSNRTRPKLVKKLWRVTSIDNTDPFAPRLKINDSDQALPQVQDLCLYATDAKFEVFVKNNRRNDPGDYYDAEQLINPPRRAYQGLGSPPVFQKHRNSTGWAAPNFMVQTYYNERWNGLPQSDLGLLEPAANGLPTLFHTPGNFGFAMLSEGDKIYLEDADTQQSGTASIDNKEYTIKAFVIAGTNPLEPWTPTQPLQKLRIQFEETIDVSPPQGVTIPAQGLSVRWTAAWTPPALRATLRIKDEKSLELRTVSRIFKILSN